MRKRSSHLVNIYGCHLYTSQIFAFASLLAFFNSLFRSFHVFLSAPSLSRRAPPYLFPYWSASRLRSILSATRQEHLNTFFFNLGFALGSGSDAKFFYLWPGNFFCHVGGYFSRTFVMYARSFMKWNLLPVCWIPANVCRQTVPFKLYVSRHSNRGSWLNSIASHECLRGFRRKFVFRWMSTGFFFLYGKASDSVCISSGIFIFK